MLFQGAEQDLLAHHPRHGESIRRFGRRDVAEGFTHHNPWFAADRESLLVAMEQSAASEPNKAFIVKQVIAAGDRVAVFSHLQREQAGGARQQRYHQA